MKTRVTVTVADASGNKVRVAVARRTNALVFIVPNV